MRSSPCRSVFGLRFTTSLTNIIMECKVPSRAKRQAAKAHSLTLLSTSSLFVPPRPNKGLHVWWFVEVAFGHCWAANPKSAWASFKASCDTLIPPLGHSRSLQKGTQNVNCEIPDVYRQVETLGFQHLDLEVTTPRATWQRVVKHTLPTNLGVCHGSTRPLQNLHDNVLRQKVEVAIPQSPEVKGYALIVSCLRKE